MADQRLPEKGEKITATPNLEVHVVDPNDPTQHPTGSSFRMKLSNLLNLGTNTLLGLVDVLITTYGGNGGKILRINLAETGIEAIDNVFLNLNDVTESTYANFDNYVVSVVPGGGLQFTPKTFLSLTDVSATYLDERNEGSVAMVVQNKITGEFSVNFKPVPTFDDLFGGSAIIRGGLAYRGFGLNYTIWGEKYIINGRLIEISVSGEVTNDPGDNEFNRFDVYYIETDNQIPETISVGILKGTAQDDPVIPTLDLTTQVQVSVRLIERESVTDPDAVTNVIYDEDQSPPLEWLNTALPSGANLNYVNNPKVGLVSILVPQILNSDVLTFKRDSFFTYISNDYLIFYINPLTLLPIQAQFQFKLINSENGNYWNLNLSATQLRNYGSNGNSNEWQLIQIQLNEFSSTSRDETLFDTLEVTFTKTPEMQLDWFVIQSNVPNPVTDVSSLDSVTTKGNITPNDIYIGQAFSTRSSLAEIEAADDNVLVPKSYVRELSEIPSGLTMFELKDKELYLSVDGEMPKKVDLSPIASEVKTVKLTITAAEIREASQYIDGNDNPNLTPVVLVPNPADGSAVVATEVLCKTTPINGMYDDSGGMGWIMPNKDLTLVLDHKEDYYQLMLNSSFLSPNYGDEPLGSPRYEKAKERDVGGFLNIGEAYNSFEEGKGIIFLFNEYLDAYPGTSIELIIKYQNITF